ncbi:MAG: 23S rRNA (adenine(2503)-C(2))-methyltransferase RlmN [Bacteroidetes bacterium]|nr:MAG: 23S rRNA (adenine(2503)-C(2))-methyltransferase RlmN [Bacteroidota bacterium]
MYKQNIKGLTLNELQRFALSLGEKAFRGNQLFDWLYSKEALSFNDMTSLSKDVRVRLESVAEISAISLTGMQASETDGTRKFLFELSDGKRIESVLIPPRTAFQGRDAVTEDEQERLTLCISTQVGCPLDCAFCATASMGFLRNLATGEIIDQITQVRKSTGRRITNLVYMGMGEPLLNYDNVMNSVEIIIAGMNIAARHITISTAGWVPGIRRLADEKRKIKLALSLHSFDDSIRSQLMPVNKKYPLNDVMEALAYYYAKVKRRVTFEYILFDGLNDANSDVNKLIALAKRIPCKINIIPFHDITTIAPTGFAATLRPTPGERMEAFVEQLRRNHLTVFVRSSAGEDIAAACGQLAVKHERKSGQKRLRATRDVSGKAHRHEQFY